MADIFISYSRMDSEQALSLAEKLRAEGMEVWIDQHGLEGATSWSKEIIEAIESSMALVVLLSASSILSDNVTRELSIAFDAKKTILPIELELVTLPTEFKYQLAGIQRVGFKDHEAILRSLKKLGIPVAQATPPVTHDFRPASALVAQAGSPVLPDLRKSLIVLPFEDLSPSGEDNAWFADGLAGEMIDAFGHIKSLRILDRKTSISLRATKLRTVEIGKEFNTRYFIEGSVRKFGEQIKISVALLDIETGDYLWQESHRGEFKDIFDIQEAVAQKVVEGLKLHLTKEEKTLLQERGTENAEAYELAVKATEYNARATKQGLELAIQLLSEAIELDPGYAWAYQFKADSLAKLYRGYNQNPSFLEEGLKLVGEALRLKPDLWVAYHPLSFIQQLQGNLEAAEEAVREYIHKAPESPSSHASLGYFYSLTGQYAEAIAPYERSVKLDPENLTILFGLVVTCSDANVEEKQIFWAQVAIPAYERHLRLFPDDENARVNHSLLLFFAGRLDQAKEAALQLENITDGPCLRNIAALQCLLHDYDAGLITFRKSVKAGFRLSLTEFLNDEKEGIALLKGTPEYEEVRLMVEKIEAEQLSAANKEQVKSA